MAGEKPKPSGIRFTEATIFARMNESNWGTSDETGEYSSLSFIDFERARAHRSKGMRVVRFELMLKMSDENKGSNGRHQ